MWIFFTDANFVIFSKTFLARSLNIFPGIIGIKLQISIACLEKISCENLHQIKTQLARIAYGKHI